MGELFNKIENSKKPTKEKGTPIEGGSLFKKVGGYEPEEEEVEGTKLDTSVNLSDVVKEIPSATKKVGAKTADFVTDFLPAAKNYLLTTGGIFGEAIAYARDPIVREQYDAGNLDVLPTITENTPVDVIKDTFAAGIEAAILKSVPDVSKMKIGKRVGLGALEGVGYGFSEGLANDWEPEEIIDNMPTYAAMGGGVNVIAPYLLPLLKSEAGQLPKNLKNTFKGLKDEIRPGSVRRSAIKNKKNVEIPDEEPRVFEQGETYQKYKQANKFEPITPDDELPTIDFGDGRMIKRKADEGLPTIDIDEPLTNVSAPRRPILERISALSDVQKKEVMTLTRRLAFSPEVGKPGMDWALAQETALARFEAKIGETEGVLRLIPEEEAVTRPNINEARIARQEQELSQRKTLEGRTESRIAGEPQEARITKVSSEQLPVGEGDVQVSRLEARMKGYLDSDKTRQRAIEEGIETYNTMNKKTQMRQALVYAKENPAEALAIARGEIEPPKGLLRNSITLAVEEVANDINDVNLVTKLGSLRSTRLGQELSILTEADPLRPTNAIHEIIQARKQGAVKKIKGAKTITDVDKEVTKIAREAKKAVDSKRMKVERLEKLLDSIVC